MRLLHLVHQYPPEYVGGTEHYTQAVARELGRRGHEVAVLYRGGEGGRGIVQRSDEAVKVWAASDGDLTMSRRFLTTWGSSVLRSAFTDILNVENPDLIHIQHLMAWPAALLEDILAADIPFILTLHDYWWVCANALLVTDYSQALCDGPCGYVNCARCALVRAGHPRLWPAIPFLAGGLFWRNQLLRRFLRSAKMLVAPSAFVRDWYVAQGVPADNVMVIPHGIQIPPQIPTMPHEGTLRFAYVGAIAWHKGVHVVLEAFHEAPGVAQFYIAGDMSFDPQYSQRLQELASPRVQFLGKLSRSEVWNLLSKVDVVVVPSLCYESFSLIVREAFAANVPVIVSDLGALAEAVHDGVNGFCVPAGDVGAWRDTFNRILVAPGQLQALRSHIVPPLTLEAHVDQLVSLYGQCVDSSMGA